MRIFLVEDSEVILEHLRRTISDVPGAEVIGESNNQDDAITGITATHPDIVVLDLSLTKGSGIEVLRRIRPLLPKLRIIVLTNNSAPQYRSKCLSLGADLFLDKSRDFEHLAQHFVMMAH